MEGPGGHVCGGGLQLSAVAAGFPFAIEKQGSDRLVQPFLARLGPVGSGCLDVEFLLARRGAAADCRRVQCGGVWPSRPGVLFWCLS